MLVSTAQEASHDRYDYVRCRPADADAGLPGSIHLRWRCAVFRSFRRGHGPVCLHALSHHERDAKHRPYGRSPVYFHGRGAPADAVGGTASDLHGPVVWRPPRRPGYFDDSGRCPAGSLYRCCRCQRGCHGPDLAARHAGAQIRQETGHRDYLCVRYPRSDCSSLNHPYYSGRCPWPSGRGSVQGRGLARRCVGGSLHHLHSGAHQAPAGNRPGYAG